LPIALILTAQGLRRASGERTVVASLTRLHWRVLALDAWFSIAILIIVGVIGFDRVH